jgi:hypothetical protein
VFACNLPNSQLFDIHKAAILYEESGSRMQMIDMMKNIKTYTRKANMKGKEYFIKMNLVT